MPNQSVKVINHKHLIFYFLIVRDTEAVRLRPQWCSKALGALVQQRGSCPQLRGPKSRSWKPDGLRAGGWSLGERVAVVSTTQLGV